MEGAVHYDLPSYPVVLGLTSESLIHSVLCCLAIFRFFFFFPFLLHLQVLEVQVSLVLVSWLVSTMTVRDDGVQQILEDLVGLLITSDAANSHDEGVT